MLYPGRLIARIDSRLTTDCRIIVVVLFAIIMVVS